MLYIVYGRDLWDIGEWQLGIVIKMERINVEYSFCINKYFFDHRKWQSIFYFFFWFVGKKKFPEKKREKWEVYIDGLVTLSVVG